MIYSVIATMGSGKTLFASLFAYEYSKKYPERKIYANYRLRLPNSVYTRFGFLPFSELNECMIILDDFLALKQNLQSYTQIVANASRKNDLDLIFTAQYYTFIPPAIRVLSKTIRVKYYKAIDLLLCAVQREPESNQYDSFLFRNAVKISADLYDTREIVAFSSLEDYAAEIAKIAKTDEDIKRNVELFTQSESKREKLRELIACINRG